MGLPQQSCPSGHYSETRSEKEGSSLPVGRGQSCTLEAWYTPVDSGDSRGAVGAQRGGTWGKESFWVVRLARHGVTVRKAVLCLSSLEGTGHPSGGRRMTQMAWAGLSQPSKPMIGGPKWMCSFFNVTVPPKEMFPQGHKEKILGSISH